MIMILSMVLFTKLLTSGTSRWTFTLILSMVLFTKLLTEFWVKKYIYDNLNMYINDHLRIHTSDYTFRSTQLDFKYDSFY